MTTISFRLTGPGKTACIVRFTNNTSEDAEWMSKMARSMEILQNVYPDNETMYECDHVSFYILSNYDISKVTVGMVQSVLWPCMTLNQIDITDNSVLCEVTVNDDRQMHMILEEQYVCWKTPRIAALKRSIEAIDKEVAEISKRIPMRTKNVCDFLHLDKAFEKFDDLKRAVQEDIDLLE